MSWTQTCSGQAFDLLARDPLFTADDVCYGLGRETRFKGQYAAHVPFYSVAEHSVIMVEHLEDLGGFSVKDHRTVAMHDAPEFILGDLTRPVKREVLGFDDLEARVYSAIARRFDLHDPIPIWVEELDDRMLLTERIHLMAPCSRRWEVDDLAPISANFRFWEPRQAVKEYRRLLNRLGVLRFSDEVGPCV